MNRHRFSYIRYGNCLFWLLYLYFTGRLSEILMRTTNNGFLYWHFLGITHKQNIVHLAYLNGKMREQDFPLNAPISLVRPEIFRKKLLRKAKYISLIKWYSHEYHGV